VPNQTQTGGSDWQADDEVLVAELRHAFGVGCEGERGREPVSVKGFRSSGASSALGSPRRALPAGTRLADFEIIDELGRGGMGVVYRARQLSLRREIALKVLPDYARHGRTGVRRFQNEAQAAARLNHTNIVPIYAQGEYEGNYYYAMKLVEGASLDTVIRTHPELLSSTHHSRSASAPIGMTIVSSHRSWRGWPKGSPTRTPTGSSIGISSRTTCCSGRIVNST
jgi:hypothetical protein